MGPHYDHIALGPCAGDPALAPGAEWFKTHKSTLPDSAKVKCHLMAEFLCCRAYQWSPDKLGWKSTVQKITEVGPELIARNVVSWAERTKFLGTMCSIVLTSSCEIYCCRIRLILLIPTPSTKQLAPRGTSFHGRCHLIWKRWLVCNSGATESDWRSKNFFLCFLKEFPYCEKQTECNQLVELGILFPIHQLAQNKCKIK